MKRKRLLIISDTKGWLGWTWKFWAWVTWWRWKLILKAENFNDIVLPDGYEWDIQFWGHGSKNGAYINGLSMFITDLIKKIDKPIHSLWLRECNVAKDQEQMRKASLMMPTGSTLTAYTEVIGVIQGGRETWIDGNKMKSGEWNTCFAVKK